MYFLITTIGALALAVIQTAFLSHLPTPFRDLCFPVIAITWSVISGRPLTAALWALCAGVMLDLHGLFGFGTEILALFVAFAVVRVLFDRLFSNASTMAVFLLAAAAALARTACLAIIDGTRIVFGGVPYLIAPDWEVLAVVFRSMLVNGLATVLLLVSASYLRRRMERTFLPRP